MISPAIPLITEKEDSKPLEIKPLFKLRICDVLRLEYNEEEDSHTLKNRKVSYVSCAGNISDVFREDGILFSFLLDDGTGTIECIHKVGYADTYLGKLKERRPVQLLSTTLCSNSTTVMNDTTVIPFANDEIDPVMKELEKETNERIEKVMSWFNDQVVYNRRVEVDIGKCIHITGLVYEAENSSRKINVLDYRMVPVDEEHDDLVLEVDYLRNNVYE